METRIQLRRDTGANWTSNNPVLATGEVGIDTTLNNFKIGDGLTAWNGLPYLIEIASQNEAEEGNDNEVLMTPLRTAQAISTQVSSQLSSGSYLTQTDFDNQIGNFGGTGILWDSGEENYDLDFASLAEVETGTETDKVISPYTASALVIDGGEF